MMKVGEILNRATQMFLKAGIEEAIIESETLVQKELNLSRADLYLNLTRTVPFDMDSFERKLEMRNNRFPLAYILKEVQFMGLDFLIDERAMVPRQETEVLVESVLNYITIMSPEATTTISRVNSATTISRVNSATTILDIGTGCGNIAVSLAKYIPNSKIYATDISGEAIELARENMKRNGISEKRISFFQGDLFEPLKKLDIFGKIDIIVSNLPYIPSGDIQSLQSEIHFEPRIALDGGVDGLEFYRMITDESPPYLKKGGYLFLEIGYDQADRVKSLVLKNDNLVEFCVVRDYNGISRVIRARKN